MWHNWPHWFKSKGMHVPQSLAANFTGRNRPNPVVETEWNLLALLALKETRRRGSLKSELEPLIEPPCEQFPQVWLDWKPQQLIEPLLYKLGSVVTVLKGCLAASSNSSFVRFMEPHTSQFKLFWGKMKCFVFDHVWKISSKYNASRNNKNLEHLYKFCKLKLGNLWEFSI